MRTFVITSVLITGCIALGLIVSQRPVDDLRGEGLEFTNLSQATPLKVEAFEGQSIRYVEAGANVPLAVIVHGSGWHGGQWDALAGRLAQQGLADVLVPDLRGHGAAPQRRGDIDYIRQFEDDLAALIKAKVKPGQQVMMIGHSSGGGLVVRFAGGKEATRSYSYRLNTSFAPRPDYLSEVAALPDFDLVVETDDEAFFADQYQPVMSAVTDKGSYTLVPDVGHLGIVDHEQTVDVIKTALGKVNG